MKLIFHIPHSSTYVPPAVRPAILLSDIELQDELLRITDAYTDELFQFDFPDSVTVRYPVSRLVVDPERFEDDAEEDMAQRGMGVIYVNTSDSRPLRQPPSPAERKALLDAYYRPHHRELERTVSAGLANDGRCLIIDCHSFPFRPLPYEVDQDLHRPDICIGTDEFHSPPDLVKSLVAGFEKAGYKVILNRPFSGSLVPALFYRKEKRVASVMIEVNRALYMDETDGKKANGFGKLRENLTEVLSTALASTF